MLSPGVIFIQVFFVIFDLKKITGNSRTKSVTRPVGSSGPQRTVSSVVTSGTPRHKLL